MDGVLAEALSTRSNRAVARGRRQRFSGFLEQSLQKDRRIVGESGRRHVRSLTFASPIRFEKQSQHRADHVVGASFSRRVVCHSLSRPSSTVRVAAVAST